MHKNNNRFSTVTIKAGAAVLLLLLTICFCADAASVEDKVAVLITGWGMPAGYNFHYSWTSSDYPRAGDKAEYAGQPCKIGHSGEFPFDIHVGIIPWSIHSGNVEPCSSEGGDLFFDYTGIYQYDSENELYVSIYPDKPPVSVL